MCCLYIFCVKKFCVCTRYRQDDYKNALSKKKTERKVTGSAYIRSPVPFFSNYYFVHDHYVWKKNFSLFFRWFSPPPFPIEIAVILRNRCLKVYMSVWQSIYIHILPSLSFFLCFVYMKYLHLIFFPSVRNK